MIAALLLLIFGGATAASSISIAQVVTRKPTPVRKYYLPNGKERLMIPEVLVQYDRKQARR